MSYVEPLVRHSVAISVSESPDMPALGLSAGHLRDAMAEIARHLLALGARLAYGGDLREHGFSELLFELVARHGRDADSGSDRTSVTNYLAWPVHIVYPVTDLEEMTSELAGSAELACLQINGARLPMQQRRALAAREPTQIEWSQGLSSMRQTMLGETTARVVLGGRVDNYRGVMPGIAEEALLSLQAGQPLFLMGGFGGCARDIAETLGLVPPWKTLGSAWPSRTAFRSYSWADLNNGLSSDENATLARTPHVDQAVTLILRGLLRAVGGDA